MAEFRDVYGRITNRIIADLEQGVRPWMRPWRADHAAGRITRPLRHNGIPYKGYQCRDAVVRVRREGLRLPAVADLQFKQALELGGHVKKGETGELVVYNSKTFRRLLT
jgi:antirestriction protein ArdC